MGLRGHHCEHYVVGIRKFYLIDVEIPLTPDNAQKYATGHDDILQNLTILKHIVLIQ